MSDEDLMRRIDLALRAQPLPPERLLLRIIHELQRARGGELGDYYADDGRYFEDDDISVSSRGSSRGGSSLFSYDSMASSLSNAMMSSTSSIRPEHTSLPMRDHDDLVKDRYAAQYELRKVAPPEDERAREIRKLQDKLQQAKLLQAQPHVDDPYRPLEDEEGGVGAPTKLGSVETRSKSMYAHVEDKTNKTLFSDMPLKRHFGKRSDHDRDFRH